MLRSQLPLILARVARIPDPRRQASVEHDLTTLLLYGMLLFVYQYASRREGNRELSRPEFLAALRTVFPELATTPHVDTVERLLERIPAEDIEAALHAVVGSLLRSGKLRALLVGDGWVVAFDGSQKMARSWQWAEQALRRQVGGDELTTRYSAYVLQATLVGPQGVRIPLATEFCTNAPQPGPADPAAGAPAAAPAGAPAPATDAAPPTSAEQQKQDCELKAFKRLAARVKAAFPRRRLLVVADGLYANGPVMALCRRYGWDFMLVLRDESLPAFWKEVNGLHRLTPENACDREWGGRRQHFWWVNAVRYEFGPNDRQHLDLNVVVCEETWSAPTEQEPDRVEHARFAWISAEPLSAKNVHARCNRAGRHRWDIEENFLSEKHHGYQFSHVFSYHWNAMRAWHYLMEIAELLNTLALFSVDLWDWVCARGFRATLEMLRESYKAPWLDHQRLRALVQKPPQLRLVF
ncbi:MAG: transposase family protein [Candidatus Xenobia bacterium]